jgi:hypothetical protein
MTRIPLPGNGAEALQRGVEHGTSAFANLLGQGIQRAQMHQAHAHHQDTHAIQQQQQARLAELQPYVIEQYKQQAAAHPYIIEQYKQAAALAPYEQQRKIAEINNFVSQQAQREFDQNFVKQFMGGQMGGQGSPMQQPAAQIPGQQSGMPQGQGQPMVAPPSMQQIQQGFGGQQTHPALAAKMKKLTGWDPNELSQEQKDANSLELFKKKEEYKKDQDLNKPTTATVTKQQSIISGGNAAKHNLKRLKSLSAPIHFGDYSFSPNEYADYEGAVESLLDNLLEVRGLSGTSENKQAARKEISRRDRESEANWKKRLDILDKEIDHRMKLASDINKTKKVEPQHESNSGMLKGVDASGQKWEVKPEDKEGFMKAGGKIL